MQYKLRECRKKAGLSEKKVAEALNTTQQQINKYETGKQKITLERAIELADLYGISLDELAGRNTPNTQELTY